MFWDMIISLAILYSAVEIPFTTAFLRVPPTSMQVLDVLIDAVLLTDVVVCFFTGYVDQDDQVSMEHTPTLAPIHTLTMDPEHGPVPQSPTPIPNLDQ